MPTPRRNSDWLIVGARFAEVERRHEILRALEVDRALGARAHRPRRPRPRPARPAAARERFCAVTMMSPGVAASVSAVPARRVGRRRRRAPACGPAQRGCGRQRAQCRARQTTWSSSSILPDIPTRSVGIAFVVAVMAVRFAAAKPRLSETQFAHLHDALLARADLRRGADRDRHQAVVRGDLDRALAAHRGVEVLVFVEGRAVMAARLQRGRRSTSTTRCARPAWGS